MKNTTHHHLDKELVTFISLGVVIVILAVAFLQHLAKVEIIGDLSNGLF